MRVRSGIVWVLVACLLAGGVIVWLLADAHDPAPGGSRGDRLASTPRAPEPAGPALATADPAADPGAVRGRLVGPKGLSLDGVCLVVGVLEDRGAGWLRPRERAQVPVEASGRFTTRIAGPGPLWIHASLTQGGRDYRTCFVGPRDGVPRFLVLRPPDPGRGTWRLRVSALLPDGRTLAQGSVRFSQAGDATGGRERWERLQAGGPASFDVPATRHGMWVACVPRLRGAASCTPLVAGPLPSAGGHIYLTLPAATSILGRVIDQRGDGVANEILTVRPAVPDFPTKLDAARWPVVLTDAEGCFDLSGLPRGAYEVVFRHLVGARPHPVHTERGPALIRVATGASVEITVMDAAGQPLPAARVRAVPVERDRAEKAGPPVEVAGTRVGLCDERGVAPLHGLDPKRTYALSVWPPQGRGDLRGLFRDDWSPHARTVTLVAKELVRVDLRDEEGRALPHALVYRGFLEAGPDQVTFDPLTRAQGGRWQMDLPQGATVDLYATHGGLPPEGAQPHLTVTRAGDFTLTLARGPTLRLRLVGLAGPTEGLGVRVEEEGGRATTDEERRRAFARLDAEGRCEVFGLSGERRFTALIGDATKGGWGWKSGLRPGGDEVVVEAGPGGPVQGTVLRARGVIEDGAFVTVNCLGLAFEARVDDHGRFRLPDVPPGRWQAVAVVLHGGYVVRRGSVAVQPNASVTITLQDVEEEDDEDED